MSKVFVWANSDLDGAGSVVLLSNVFKELEYRSVFFGNFLKEYEEWDNEKYTTIFVVGMVLDQSLVNRINDPRVIFVSDRGETLRWHDATAVVENTSSCTKLLYQKFKDKRNFTSELKRLVLYVDDYNDYALKYKESEYLNATFRKTKYNRFTTFVNRFIGGYDGFTDAEIKIGDEFFAEIEKEARETDYYVGTFKGTKVVAFFTKLSVNEMAKKAMEGVDGEVFVVVNLDTQFVSFRKRKDSQADIVFMAESLCGGGGGEWASGGSLTKKFLAFTETLEKI